MRVKGHEILVLARHYCDNTLFLCLFSRPLVTKFGVQSRKTQGFRVADFATLSDERRSRLKIFLLFNMDKKPCVQKFEGLARSKVVGILQTMLASGNLLEDVSIVL